MATTIASTSEALITTSATATTAAAGDLTSTQQYLKAHSLDEILEVCALDCGLSSWQARRLAARSPTSSARPVAISTYAAEISFGRRRGLGTHAADLGNKDILEATQRPVSTCSHTTDIEGACAASM